MKGHCYVKRCQGEGTSDLLNLYLSKYAISLTNTNFSEKKMKKASKTSQSKPLLYGSTKEKFVILI